MSRAVPWRNKPTPFLLEMVEEVKTYKLYLVNQLGPTSFVFKDDNENKFKVTIGGKLSCSCGVVQNDHCLHTLYVLLKKYKVDEQNPILWQASYLDSELEGLVQYKYSSKRKPQTTHKFLRKPVEASKEEKHEEDDFPQVSDDDSCPICYEALKGECYSQCQQCRNCIHTKCLKVWVRHKQESGASVTCPMCRSEFHNPTGLIAKDTEKWNNRFLIHKGVKCVGCNTKNIKGVLFHCLICQQANLCRLCFEDGQHPEHQHFLMKQQADAKWIMAPARESQHNRVPIYKSIHQRPQDTIEKVLEVGGTLPNPILLLLTLFPSLKELQSRTTFNTGELNIVGNEVKTKSICCKCSQLGNDSMRKLGCGHTIHQECLELMVSKGDYQCDTDGELFAKGYLSAMGIKPVKKVKKPMVDLVYDGKGQQLMKQLLEMHPQKTRQPHLLGSSFQNSLNTQQLQSKRPNITAGKSEKASFAIRSNSLRKKVEANRNFQPQNFLLLGNSNPLMMVTGLHALPPTQPRTRSTLKPPHF